MRILRFPDVNSDAGSSPASAKEGATSTDVTSSSSSTETTSKADEKAEPTLNDVISDVVKKSSEASSEKESAEESRSKNEQDLEKKKEGTEKEDGPQNEEKGAEGETSKEEESKGPVPYTRFQEIVEERNTFKEQVTQTQPLVENYRNIVNFCQEQNITPKQFNDALEIRALLNSNPAEALKRLTPIVDSLQGFTGGKLPEDLQKDVDEDKISIERAKELAQLRAEKQFGSKASEHQQKIAHQREMQRSQEQLTVAARSWEQGKQKTDPDYKPKAKATDPDGKWEDVRDKFLAMLHLVGNDGKSVNPVTNAAEMTTLMEKAYAAVNGSLRYKKPPTSKILRSNGSSTTTKTESIESAPTLAIAIERALAPRK